MSNIANFQAHDFFASPVYDPLNTNSFEAFNKFEAQADDQAT